MRPAGVDFDFHEGRAREILQRPETADRFLAGIGDIHHAFPAALGAIQGQADFFPFQRPAAGHQRQVALLHAAFAQQLVQPAQGTAFLCDQQYAGSLAIQPVHQFEIRCIRTHRAQRFQTFEMTAAAPVHRHAGRFVDRQQPGIFENDPVLQLPENAIRRRRIARLFGIGLANRRNTHLIAGFHLVGRLDAALVDPNLAGTKNAIHHAARNALQHAQQVIVDTLSGFIGRDSRNPDLGGRKRGVILNHSIETVTYR